MIVECTFDFNDRMDAIVRAGAKEWATSGTF